MLSHELLLMRFGSNFCQVDEDLQFLLENSAKVEESMKKHSDELSKSVIFQRIFLCIASNFHGAMNVCLWLT